jgi:hypothetical protein
MRVERLVLINIHLILRCGTGILDADSGLYYYYHIETNEVTWNKPEEGFIV